MKLVAGGDVRFSRTMAAAGYREIFWRWLVASLYHKIIMDAMWHTLTFFGLCSR